MAKFNKPCAFFAVLAAAAFVVQGTVIPKLHTNEITKEYKYLAESDTALPEDLAESFEQDGVTYVLPKDYEKLTKIETESEDFRHTETATITGLTSMQAPETKDFDIGGKTVTLVLESADYTPIERSYNATGEVEYPNQKSKPKVPEMADISYETSDGDIITVKGSLVNVTSSEGNGGGTTKLESTISMPAWSPNAFTIGEKLVAYDPASPRWDGYEEDVAKAAGLSNGQKVVGGTWASKEYQEDGFTKRDVVWYIQGATTSWTAHYAAEGTITTYTADAVYSGSVQDLGLDESAANDVKYTLNTKVTYIPEGSVQGNPVFRFFAENPKVLPITGFVSLILALLCFVTGKSKKKAPKQNDPQNDEDWLMNT